MAQLITNPLRIQVNGSPNQLVTNSDPTVSLDLMRIAIYNPNTSDVWAHFYQETSGNVTVGTTHRLVSPILVPSGAQYIEGATDQSNPIQSFSSAITVAITTTSTGTTSATSYCEVGITYRR